MTNPVAIHWFRQDLRLADNPALIAASKHQSILPIFIFDDVNVDENIRGSASKVWLHHSLEALKKSLNGNLSFYRGNPEDILKSLCQTYDVEAVYWNRCYEPWRMHRDTKIKNTFKEQEISVESFNGSLLWEPWTIKKADGTPYKVFTPFYRKGCLNAAPPREPEPIPNLSNAIIDTDNSIELDDLNLLPSLPWGENMVSTWDIGEAGAHQRFQNFIAEGLEYYKGGRDLPAKPYVSRLSPSLHFGEVSPNQLWYALRNMEETRHIDHFCSELGWREFSYSQLYYNPDLPTQNLQSKFDHFPWQEDQSLLEKWQQGLTGIPMVDAGMRELWQTGYMHNRVRMIVGSYLVKNMRLHWKHGERWFWDTLVDADLANNSASWQWIAGCGADAAPYFRIFNPVTQGQKFDPDGDYIRKYIPEIANLPDKYLYAPWEAPDLVLKGANVVLGQTYPSPIVDLKQSRMAALEAFKSLKENTDA